LNVYAHLLSCGYLWDEIRLKGGAYGVSCAHLSQQSCFLLNSLNDPDPGRTFAIFDQLGGLPMTWTNDDIEAAIIATAKGDSVPIRPVKAGYVALWRHLFAITDAIRAEYRQRLLSVTPDDVAAAAADLWQNNAAMANDCAIAPARLTAQLPFKTLTI
jgi:Zn-dependent M16 (insulinase) family peptidase